MSGLRVDPADTTVGFPYAKRWTVPAACFFTESPAGLEAGHRVGWRQALAAQVVSTRSVPSDPRPVVFGLPASPLTRVAEADSPDVTILRNRDGVDELIGAEVRTSSSLRRKTSLAVVSCAEVQCLYGSVDPFHVCFGSG